MDDAFIKFKNGKYDEIIRHITENPQINNIFPYYILKYNRTLSLHDLFHCCKCVEFLCQKKIINYMISDTSQIKLFEFFKDKNYFRLHDKNIFICVVRYCCNLFRDAKGEFNRKLLELIVRRARSNSFNNILVKYLIKNPSITCELFAQIYQAFPFLDYSQCGLIFSKNISENFIKICRPLVYMGNNMVYLCGNPLLTPEMLFGDDSLGFKYLVGRARYTRILIAQPWCKKMLHYLKLSDTDMEYCVNINYKLYQFNLKYNLNFEHPDYKSYCRGRLRLTRDTMMYTTDENIYKYIILCIYVKHLGVKIQSQILLDILSQSLYNITC